MEIATLETILACYNPICNADSMHVVPNVNQVHPLFHYMRKTTSIHDSPITTESRIHDSPITTGSRIQPHYLCFLVSLLALQVQFHTMGMNHKQCLCMHHKSMQHQFNGI